MSTSSWDLEGGFSAEPDGRDSVLHFSVQVESETYRETGSRSWRRDWQVVITHPDKSEESHTFRTPAAAELWIGDRIMAMSEAMIRSGERA